MLPRTHKDASILKFLSFCSFLWKWKLGYIVHNNVSSRGIEAFAAVGSRKNADHKSASGIFPHLHVSRGIANLAYAAAILNTLTFHQLMNHIWERPPVFHLVGANVIIHCVFHSKRVNE